MGKLAADTILLDVREVTLIADYFVIATGGSERQVQALVESVQERLQEKGIKPLGVEGDAASGWVLLDYLDIVVHVFTAPVRRFYDLEGLWSRARTVLRID